MISAGVGAKSSSPQISIEILGTFRNLSYLCNASFMEGLFMSGSEHVQRGRTYNREQFDRKLKT